MHVGRREGLRHRNWQGMSVWIRVRGMSVGFIIVGDGRHVWQWVVVVMQWGGVRGVLCGEGGGGAGGVGGVAIAVVVWWVVDLLRVKYNSLLVAVLPVLFHHLSSEALHGS